MTFWILPKSCRVIARSSVQAVSEDDLALIETQTELAELDLAIDAKIGDKVTDKNLPPDVPNPTPAVGDEDIFDGDAGEDIDPADPDATRPEADDYTPEALDEYLATDVILPHGGEAQRATVLRRKRNQDGDPIGKRNQNPILDTREYEVQFPDGSTDTCTANTIAENMYSQVDNQGREYLLLQEITDHKTDGSAVVKDDGFITSSTGQRRPRTTTRGWKLLVSWKDDSSSWVPLKDLKGSNPVEVAEYAVANKIAEEPAFT